MAETVYPVDPNHSSLRLAVLISMAVAFVVGLVGVPLLLRAVGVEGFAILLGIVAGVLFAALAAAGSERVLRRIWPSGRQLIVTDEAIRLREKSGEEVRVRWDEDIDVLAWGFAIAGRRAWVPRGWFSAAIRLRQGDETITPYAFLKPDDARGLPGWRTFVELIPRKEVDEVDEALFAAQEHLRVAEEERWWVGAEMVPEDFEALLRTVAMRVPDWPERRR